MSSSFNIAQGEGSVKLYQAHSILLKERDRSNFIKLIQYCSRRGMGLALSSSFNIAQGEGWVKLYQAHSILRRRGMGLALSSSFNIAQGEGWV